MKGFVLEFATKAKSPFGELPEDLSSLTDEVVGEREAELLAAIEAADDSTPVEDLAVAVWAVALLREEAAARYATAEAEATAAAEAAAERARLKGSLKDEPTAEELAAAETAAAAEAAALLASGEKAPARPRTPKPDAPAAPARPEPLRPATTIVAAATRAGVDAGTKLESLRAVAEIMSKEIDTMGRMYDGAPTKVPMATLMANYPEERTLRHGQDPTPKINAVTSPSAITAAGGLCAPVQPYYDILVLSEAIRPVRDALAGFNADRGGIRFIPPPRISDVADQVRSVTDGVTSSNTTVTSATAAFANADVGALITGTGIPTGTFITVIGSATSVTISQAATASATGVTLTFRRYGVSRVITDTADAAALGVAVGTTGYYGALKPVVHATCPTPVEVHLQAITKQVEFGNFTARAYPEQVVAWLALALAQWARTAEVALLDGLASNSTQVTAGQIGTSLGAARAFVAQVTKAAAYYRNFNRMSPDTPLRSVFPAWAVDMMVADLVLGSGYETEFFAQARAEVAGAIQNAANVSMSFYVDSGTGKGQYFNSGAVQAAGALTTFPTTAVWYLFSEGSFLFLDGGELDLGLVRDSVLNNQNNYRFFAESFENLTKVGVEALEVTSTVAATGGYSPAASAVTAF